MPIIVPTPQGRVKLYAIQCYRILFDQNIFRKSYAYNWELPPSQEIGNSKINTKLPFIITCVNKRKKKLKKITRLSVLCNI